MISDGVHEWIFNDLKETLSYDPALWSCPIFSFAGTAYTELPSANKPSKEDFTQCDSWTTDSRKPFITVEGRHMTSDTMDMTREDMYSLVSSTMEQAEKDINDLEKSISLWNAEEHAMSMDSFDGSTLGPVTLQKVEEYLEVFFANKRMSSEPWTLDLSFSALAPMIRKFFNNLTEEWVIFSPIKILKIYLHFILHYSYFKLLQ